MLWWLQTVVSRSHLRLFRELMRFRYKVNSAQYHYTHRRYPSISTFYVSGSCVVFLLAFLFYCLTVSSHCEGLCPSARFRALSHQLYQFFLVRNSDFFPFKLKNFSYIKTTKICPADRLPHRALLTF